MRIYDKAAERGFKDLHWIRVEIQLRLDRALSAVVEIIKRQHVGDVFSGVLRNYCCFREPTNDSNKSRWPIAAYWDELINGIGRIRLWISPGEPYNFRKTEEQMIFQYGQALLAYEAIHGNIYDLLKECRQTHPELKKKYKVAISEARLERQHAAEALAKLRADLGISDDGWYEIDVDDQLSTIDYPFDEYRCSAYMRYTCTAGSTYSFSRGCHISAKSLAEPVDQDESTRLAALTQALNDYNASHPYQDSDTIINYYIGTTDEDGSVTDIYDPGIYDEETLIFTEPVTGAQYQTTGWTYDYTTRSYDITLDAGTFTIDGTDVSRIYLVYGDDAVGITYYDASGLVLAYDSIAMWPCPPAPAP